MFHYFCINPVKVFDALKITVIFYINIFRSSYFTDDYIFFKTYLYKVRFIKNKNYTLYTYLYK